MSAQSSIALPTQTRGALSSIATSSGASPNDDIGLSGSTHDVDLVDMAMGRRYPMKVVSSAMQ